MTYTLLPNSGQSLGQTRSSIRTNFSLIQTAQNTNHVAIDGSGAGKHKFLQMPEQGSAPATAVNEAGFYAKVGTSPAESNLFFRGENSGFEYQLTKADSAQTATFAGSTNGWTFLPGGLILQYGTKTGGLGTSGTITFPKPFPNTVINIQLTSRRNTAADGILIVNDAGTNDLTQFSYRANITGGISIYWIAIGN